MSAAAFGALVIALLFSARAAAAVFQVTIAGGAIMKVGEPAALEITLIPGQDERVLGGQCAVTVDPAYIELSGDRNEYAADPAFGLVEKFKASPETGVVTFRAKSGSLISGKPVFIRIPFKFRTAGSTYLSFTSSVIFEDGKSAPANPGYFRLVGYEGDEPDPLLYAASSGENVLLTAQSLADRFDIVKSGGGDAAQSAVAAQSAELGLTALEAAKDEAAADVVIGFSKRAARIGPRQWVRLDIMIEKFPAYEMMTGVQLKVKYDPSYLTFTDYRGHEAKQVDVQAPVDDMGIEELKSLAKDSGLAVGSGISREDLISLIDSAHKWEYRSVFTMPFDNRVDPVRGEINISLLSGFNVKTEDIKTPMPVVTLLFKGLRPGKDIPVTMEQVMVPVQNGTQYVRNSTVTIDSDQKACDQSLPAALCSGSFKIAGNVQFALNKKFLSRQALIRETTDAAVGGTSVTTKVDQFQLTQSWNVLLDGSLRNGMSINGTVSEMPNQPQQHLDIEVTGANGGLHFGSFDTSFQSGSFFSLDKKINGAQLSYRIGNLEFTALTAEMRSAPGVATINGGGNKGPYLLPSNVGMIIPGTVRIFEGGKEISPTQYTIDYGTREIYFNDSFDNNVTRSINYEAASFLFSTGNMNAFQLGYSTVNKKTGTETAKLGVSYIMSKAPKSNTRVTGSAEKAVLEADLPINETRLCPNLPSTSTKRCTPITLDNPYVVPGSIRVAKGTDEMVPGGINSPIIVDYRGYYLGRIYIIRNDPASVGKVSAPMTVKYDYYRPDLVSETGFIAYQIPITGLINTSGQSWPQNMFPGSEIVLASADQTNVADNRSDSMLCYSENGIINDDPTLCPLFYQRMQGDITYKISKENQPYLEFSQAIPKSVNNFEYIKVKYAITPTEMSSGSEFTKAAMDVNGKFNIGKNLSVEGEYATSNSDLASSFNTDEEVINIDASSAALTANDGTSDNICRYYGDRKAYGSEAERELVCHLRHGNLTGQATVKVRHCDRGIIPADVNPADVPCIKVGGNIQYQLTAYPIGYNYYTIDRQPGTVVLIRRRDSETNPNDPGYTDFGHYFPSAGDQIEISYVYDKALGRVVVGAAKSMSMNYRGRRLNASITSAGRDAFFDNLGGQKESKPNNSLSGSLDLTLKNLRLAYSLNNTESQTIVPQSLKKSGETINSNQTLTATFGAFNFGLNTTTTNTEAWNITNFKKSGSSQLDTIGYSASYVGKGHLSSLNFKRSTNSNTGVTGLDTGTTHKTNSEVIANTYDFTSKFLKNNKLLLGGGYTDSIKSDSSNPTLDGREVGDTLNLKYDPWTNFGINADITRKSSPGYTRARNTNYKFHYIHKFHYVPFKNLIDFNAAFANSVPSLPLSTTTGATTPSSTNSTTQTDSFDIAVKDSFYRVSNLGFSIRTTNTPTTTGASNKTNGRSLKFDVALPYGMKWSPSYSRSTSGEGGSWRQSETQQWTLGYNRDNKKLRTANWTRTKTTTKAPPAEAGAVAAAVTPQTGNDLYSFNIRPSTNASVMLSYSVIPAAFSNEWNMTYNYTYNDRVKFNTGFKMNRTNGASFSRTMNCTLGTSVYVTPKTYLQMEYMRDISRARATSLTAGSAIGSNTDLKATLNSSF
ncbi:MAG: hypothetical protein WCX65_01435 [bacterium]